MPQPESRTDAIDWNPVDGDVVLIATDATGVDTARELLAGLPRDARGTAFIEVETEQEVGVLVAPRRFSVRWLVRERGQRLERSVDAWLEEMLPVTAFGEDRVYAWVASRGPARLLTAG